MEETPKKGARDISDLKARLGLKKTAPPGAPSQAPGGPPVPPGVNQPPPPDPRRDPFAATQPLATPMAYYVPADLPGADDGKPAKPISEPKPWGKIGVVAGIAVVLFAFGNACGRIYESRSIFNRTIDDSVKIRNEVEKMSKKLQVIAERISASPAATKGNPDVQLAVDLGTLDLKKPDTQLIFHTNYYRLDDLAIERLFNYYNETVVLYDRIAQNAKKTEADKEAIESFLKNAAAKGDKNYGVLIDATGAIPLASFVEVGSPLCPQEDQTDCAAKDLRGFRYRVDAGGTWFEKPVKGKLTDVIIPIQQGRLFKTVATGNADFLAATDHVRRTVEIRALTAKLLADQKELLADLKRSSERSKVFVF